MKEMCTCTSLLLAVGTGLVLSSAAQAERGIFSTSTAAVKQILDKNGVPMVKGKAQRQISPARQAWNNMVAEHEAFNAQFAKEGGISSAPCPNPDHDCFTTGTPGCSDEVCCDTVCAVDPFCCNTSWDGICVSEANTMCGGGGGPCPNPDHDCLTTGTPGCSDEVCCNLICGIDPFCCQTAWDSICVSEATSQCGGGGGPCPNPDHDCFTTGTPGCSDEACCNTVCGIDPFCCQTAWDGICVSEATTQCGVGPNPLDACIDRIDILLGDTAFSNIGATTDGPPHAACLFFGDDQVGADIWYNFTAGSSQQHSISLCGSGYDTKVAVYDGCNCPVSDANLIVCNDDSCGLQSQASWDAVAGQCYKIRVGGYAGSVGSGNINISEGAPPSACDAADHPCDVTGGPGCTDIECCLVVCAADSFCCQVAWDGICVNEALLLYAEPCELPGKCDNLEGEDCGLDTNGGCNSTPAVYGDLDCGRTVCGNMWADANLRDTDWYHFTVDVDGTSVTWTVYSQVPSVSFIVNDDCGFIVVISPSVGNCPSVAEATGCSALAAGQYVAFTAPAVFAGFPCGGKNEYQGTLVCTPPCVGDIDEDGDVDVDDLIALINNWGACD